jgi:hypothetical protein
MRRLFHRLVPLSVFLALCSAGCRFESYRRLPESGATLEGTVTYGGVKVPAALVIAEGDGPAATAWVDEDGHFKLENVPLGEVRIGVNTQAGEGRRRGMAMARSQGKGGPLPDVVHVPTRYFTPAESGITTTINQGANKFDVAISE